MRSGTEWNTPRRSALSVSSRNQRSTRLSHDEEVGVKCSWNRGCLSSQARTLSCLVSSRGESHPPALAEPYVTVARHTAPTGRLHPYLRGDPHVRHAIGRQQQRLRPLN